MGPLVAIGGLLVTGDVVRECEKALDDLCKRYMFPRGEEFKWSPGKELWMRKNLIAGQRTKFYLDVLDIVTVRKAKALVVIADKSRATATRKARNAEEDVTCMFLERVQRILEGPTTRRIVVVSRPSGGQKDEVRFLEDCFDTLRRGTEYVMPKKITLVLPSPPKTVRLLQVADIITSCTLARVAGENKFTPPVFDKIKNELLVTDFGRVGGCGLKLHPDFNYTNLYHWLLGDKYLKRGNIGWPLPMTSRPYSKDPMVS